MKKVMTRIARFRFYGPESNCSKGVEIIFGRGELFWSCAKGADLNTFDELLATYLPDLDFEKITYCIARNLEKKLYRCLEHCKDQASALKAFISFLAYVEKKFCMPVRAANDITKVLVRSVVFSAREQMCIVRQIHKNRLLEIA